LFESLTRVISSESSQPAKPVLYKHAPSGLSGPVSAMRILIAEDNVVNQKVATSQAHKLGCHADVVGNGREALDALEAGEYDLVLMDCQMPELDGYKATALIREREGAGRHTNIVAMTAHAIEGDREKCLAAGMDDYLSKPLRFEALKEIVQRYRPIRLGEQPAVTPENLDGLRELGADDDGDILTELIDTYLENSPRVLAAAEEALQNQEPAAVAQAAHALMGSSSNFGAKPLQDLCAQLEQAGRSPNFEKHRAAQLLAAIRTELDRVCAALGEYRSTP